jgi:hypothetical protein
VFSGEHFTSVSLKSLRCSMRTSAISLSAPFNERRAQAQYFVVLACNLGVLARGATRRALDCALQCFVDAGLPASAPEPVSISS